MTELKQIFIPYLEPFFVSLQACNRQVVDRSSQPLQVLGPASPEAIFDSRDAIDAAHPHLSAVTGPETRGSGPEASALAVTVGLKCLCARHRYRTRTPKLDLTCHPVSPTNSELPDSEPPHPVTARGEPRILCQHKIWLAAPRLSHNPRSPMLLFGHVKHSGISASP
jgi:hypothetical protein